MNLKKGELQRAQQACNCFEYVKNSANRWKSQS